MDKEVDTIRQISEHDPMFSYAPDLYFAAGERAVDCIRLAMRAAELHQVESILDFASGSGRVLRTLKAAFPDASLTACDIDRVGVRFCEDVLGARGVVSGQEPGAIDLDGPFDLIWCGSLFSHLRPDRFVTFLKLFDSVLSARGIAVFTVYGRYVMNELRTGAKRLNLSPEQVDQVIDDHDRTGLGFAPVFLDGNGETVTSRPWLCDLMDREIPHLRLLLYCERGWLDQDVIAVTKSWVPSLVEREAAKAKSQRT